MIAITLEIDPEFASVHNNLILLLIYKYRILIIP